MNAGPWVEVWVHGCPVDALPGRNDDRMTAEEARTLAGGLLEAAELLEVPATLSERPALHLA